MKTYCFQIVSSELTDREKSVYENYFNHREHFKDVTEDQYEDIQRKMWEGETKEVAESSVWLDLEHENSLRAAMFDAFDLWDDSDMVTTMLNLQYDYLENFKDSEITEGKILVLKEKWEKLEKNPNWGDKPADDKENVFEWLRARIGQRVRIYC